MIFPQPRTLFAGRTEDLERLSALSARTSIVTLWGPPGIGKTRLAIELCRQKALTRGGRRMGNAWFCDLTAARTASDIEAIVTRSIADGHDRAIGALATVAARGPAVVVLDNFEQAVQHAAETVGQWAERIPELWFIVTSRERLRLLGEVTHEVLPLASDGAATELFFDRIGVVPSPDAPVPDPKRVAELMARLEGIPLAIELAAARFDVLGLDGLLARIERPLELLGYGPRDAGPKHRTLRHAIETSYELLVPNEQYVLAQCAVFRGSFSLDAAEAVILPQTGPLLDLLQSLRDKSLVRRPSDEEGQIRFCLFDAVRAFMEPLLDEDTRLRHARFYLQRSSWTPADDANLVEACSFAVDHRVLVSHAIAALSGIDSAVATDAIVELLGRALLISHSGCEGRLVATGHRALGRALLLRGRLTAALRELERARDLVDFRDPLAGLVWTDLGVLHHQTRELENARTCYETALEIHVAHGDRVSEARCLGNLGAVHHDAGRHDAALDHYRRALDAFRALGDRRLEGTFLTNMAVLLQERGDQDEARRLYGSALALLGAAGDRRLEAITHSNLGLLLHERGEITEACLCHQRALEAFASVVDSRSVALCLGRLAMAFSAMGRVEDAQACWKRARSVLGRTEDRVALAILDVFEAVSRGRIDEARALASSLLAVCDDVRTALRLAEAGSHCLVVGPDAKWLCLPDGSRQDLASRRPLRRLLSRLVEQHREAPGQCLTLEALRDAGWPGERVIDEAAANRVHVALSELRRRGLRAWLLRRENGYLIDPSLRIEKSNR